jgi:hypothetical protein
VILDRDLRQCCSCNILQGTAGKEGLMPCNTPIGEGLPQLEGIVLDDHVRQILKEPFIFPFVDINTQIANLTRLNSLDYCQDIN